MILSPIAIANDYENIEIEKKDGEKVLILTEDQYISLANYIEEIETENKKLKSQLDQAEKEIEKAYNEQDNAIDLTGFSSMLTGAGIAALLITLAGD